MNISSISNTGKRSDDFAALQTALQSGNISSAQSAYAAFLQDAQKSAQTAGTGSMFAPGTQASQDLQTLGGALKSANLGGARNAFSSLLQDIQKLAVHSVSNHRGHHHPVAQSDVAANGAATPIIPGAATAALNSGA